MAIGDNTQYMPAQGFWGFYKDVLLSRCLWSILLFPATVEGAIAVIAFLAAISVSLFSGSLNAAQAMNGVLNWVLDNPWLPIAIWGGASVWILLVGLHRHFRENAIAIGNEAETIITEQVDEMERENARLAEEVSRLEAQVQSFQGEQKREATKRSLREAISEIGRLTALCDTAPRDDANVDRLIKQSKALAGRLCIECCGSPWESALDLRNDYAWPLLGQGMSNLYGQMDAARTYFAHDYEFDKLKNELHKLRERVSAIVLPN